ncbi:MAG: hypothetical protein EA390_14145 [Balneolaceae bacterium]|nr:MAG: hypothetical protein EA390_14145 [Balneolaceae bacterium]
MIQGSRRTVQGVQGAGCRVQGAGRRAQGTGHRAQGSSGEIATSRSFGSSELRLKPGLGSFRAAASIVS